MWRAVVSLIVVAGGALAGCHGKAGPPSWQASIPPIPFDIDGDGSDDVIGASQGTHGFAVALSGSDGHELWRTESIDPDAGEVALLGLANDTVLQADKSGHLAGFAAQTGKTKWQVATSGPVEALCARTIFGIALVITADKHTWIVNLATGVLSSTSVDPATCVKLPGTDTYRVAGALRGDRPPVEVPGATLDDVFTRGANLIVAIGHHTAPPTVPVVAGFDDEYRLVWKSDVPATDPATVAALAHATVGEKEVVLGYQHTGGATEVTVIDRKSGKRRWTAAVGSPDGSKPILNLGISNTAVLVVADGLESYDLKTGEKKFAVAK